MLPSDNSTTSKKYSQYIIEFIVIVFGITASFWVEEYRESLQNKEEETKVLHSLLTELDEIEVYCEKRIQSFLKDQEILLALLNDTSEQALNLEDKVDSIFPIQVAVYDYRGFQPPMVRYNSILNEGSFKYVASDSIKTKFNELNTSFLAVIEGNVKQEKEIQHAIVLHLANKHPRLITDFDGTKTYEPEYVAQLENILEEDGELRALLKIKARFGTVKMYFVGEYQKIARDLRKLIDDEIRRQSK